MRTFFRSRIPLKDEYGRVTGYDTYTYRREQPKINHQKLKAERRRKRHADLTALSVPRRVNGQRLGLRKRLEFLPAPF
jgi:hypothetical protein